MIPIIRTSFRHLPTARPRTRAAGRGPRFVRGHDIATATDPLAHPARLPGSPTASALRHPRPSDTGATPARRPHDTVTKRAPRSRARDLPNGSGGANFGGSTFPIRPAAAGFILREDSTMNGIRRRWGVGTVWSVLVLGGGPAAADDEKAYPTIGSIERSDRRIDRLVPRHATMQRLAEGFDWAEGPAWDCSGDYLLFSDVPCNTVFKW